QADQCIRRIKHDESVKKLHPAIGLVVMACMRHRRRRQLKGWRRGECGQDAQQRRFLHARRTRAIECCDQRPQQPPRRRWPFDHAFVDMMSPERSVKASGKKMQSDGDHNSSPPASSFPVCLSGLLSLVFFLAGIWPLTVVTGWLNSQAVISGGSAASNSGSNAALMGSPCGRVTVISTTSKSHAVRKRNPSASSLRVL